MSPRRETRPTSLHDLYDGDDSVHVFPGSDKALEYEYLIVFIHVTAHSTHHLQRNSMHNNMHQLAERRNDDSQVKLPTAAIRH